MNLARRFYRLLSGLESGNMGPEMYVRPEGLKQYEAVIDDSAYYVGRAEKDLWRQCAAVITRHVRPGDDMIEFGPGDAAEVQKIAGVVTALACPCYIAHDYSHEAIA